ncbi:MAG: hypothetical protein ACYDFT_03505 [Thermoplasmata archaeon]
MTGPFVSLSAALVPTAIVVVVMVAVEVFLLVHILPRRGPPPTLAHMVVITSALLGSSGLLMSIAAAFLNSNLDSYTIVLLFFNFMMLGPPSLWLVSVIVFRDGRVDPRRRFWPIAVALMATFAEILMGLVFAIGDGVSLDVVPLAAATLTSPWFLWSMAGAMFALLIWVRFDGWLRGPLAGLSASTVAAALVPSYPAPGAALMAAIMAVTFLGVYRYRSPTAPIPAERVVEVLWIVAAFLAMTLSGLFLALEPGLPAVTLLFGGVMTVVMGGELYFVARTSLLRLVPPLPTLPEGARPAPMAATLSETP